MPLGFEPIHPAQSDSTAFICSVADALAVLEEAGLSDVGLTADSYNLAAEGPDAIVASLDRVTGLHLADRPTQTIGRDARVLPGEGHGDAAAFVAAFRAAGWDGTLDVEIFSTPDALLVVARGRSRAPGVRRGVAAPLERGRRTSHPSGSTSSTCSGTSTIRPRARLGSTRSSHGRGASETERTKQRP